MGIEFGQQTLVVQPRWSMKGLSAWVSLILILAGVIAALGGHLWEKTAELLRFFFDKNFNEEIGFRLMVGGIVAILSGFGILFLLR